MPHDTRVPDSGPLAAEYDVALLDLDGVVYSGPDPIPGAAAALGAAREAGMRLAFVTNNASRSPSAIAEQLRRLGVPAASSDVVTSAQAAATLIASRFPAGSPVLVAGAIGLRLALAQGYAPDMSYGLLAEAGVAVRDGAFFVATNSDSTLPTPRGPQPGNGSLVQVIITATGKQPVVAGKPQTPLHAEAVARTGAKRPLVVGDRLDTDIEGAVRGGADSLLVLTGVTSPLDAVLAAVGRRPTYLAADLRGLLEPQPPVGPRGVRVDGDGGAANPARGAAASLGGDATASTFRCGGWEAQRSAGSAPLKLAGNGAWIDGLRALCAVAWSEQQITADMADAAMKALG